jgi:tRNA pseudouridine55 synthase
MDTIERLARTDALDALLLPLEVALAGLPRVETTAEGAARLRHGAPGMVLGPVTEWGTEAWAAWGNRAVAVGVWQAGMLHPTRVFAGA